MKNTDKIVMYSLEQIKQAFRDTFFMSGERWFDDDPGKEAERLLLKAWTEFLEYLSKVEKDEEMSFGFRVGMTSDEAVREMNFMRLRASKPPEIVATVALGYKVRWSFPGLEVILQRRHFNGPYVVTEVNLLSGEKESKVPDEQP